MQKIPLSVAAASERATFLVVLKKAADWALTGEEKGREEGEGVSHARGISTTWVMEWNGQEEEEEERGKKKKPAPPYLCQESVQGIWAAGWRAHIFLGGSCRNDIDHVGFCWAEKKLTTSFHKYAVVTLTPKRPHSPFLSFFLFSSLERPSKRQGDNNYGPKKSSGLAKPDTASEQKPPPPRDRNDTHLLLLPLPSIHLETNNLALLKELLQGEIRIAGRRRRRRKEEEALSDCSGTGVGSAKK